jgi:hypothetical protein
MASALQLMVNMWHAADYCLWFFYLKHEKVESIACDYETSRLCSNVLFVI